LPNANARVIAFNGDDEDDRAVIEGTEGPPTATSRLPFGPLTMSLPGYHAGGTAFVIGTTLLDGNRFSADDIAKPCRQRWQVEGFCRSSKRHMQLEGFSAAVENGERRELRANFNLIAMTRTVTEPCPTRSTPKFHQVTAIGMQMRRRCCRRNVTRIT